MREKSKKQRQSRLLRKDIRKDIRKNIRKDIRKDSGKQEEFQEKILLILLNRRGCPRRLRIQRTPLQCRQMISASGSA